MKEHYQLTESKYKKLLANGITDVDLFKSVDLFDPNKTGEKLGKVNLYYYIDNKGDFNSPPTKLKHKQIARAMFNSLEMSAQEQLQILEYIEASENNFED